MIEGDHRVWGEEAVNKKLQELVGNPIASFEQELIILIVFSDSRVNESTMKLSTSQPTSSVTQKRQQVHGVHVSVSSIR